MVEVELEEASQNLAELIARVESGEEIVIVQAGKAMARLVSMGETEPESSQGKVQEVLMEEKEVDDSLMEDMLSAYEDVQFRIN
jgi:prevent-host-death family protein